MSKFDSVLSNTQIQPKLIYLTVYDQMANAPGLVDRCHQNRVMSLCQPQIRLRHKHRYALLQSDLSTCQESSSRKGAVTIPTPFSSRKRISISTKPFGSIIWNALALKSFSSE
ncbi:hypothetical protein Hanom_Chr09g00826231 [Helianthus anomalus]